jgi:hypothetical protein
MARQQRNGEWLQEAIEGVFNQSWYVFLLMQVKTYHTNRI